MELTVFWTMCSANGIVMEEEQLNQILRYQKELLYWNKQINLISRQDEENIALHHIFHSLIVCKYIDLKPKDKCLDIGTGGGMPGIPIKIANPEINMLLVDSIKKKLKIAEMMAQHTGLKKIEALCTRAEDLQNTKKYVGYFDFIFARAVAQIEKLLEWTHPLLKYNGKFVFLKGGDLDYEIKVAQNKYPQYKFDVKPIIAIGDSWFEKEEKKIVIISER
jgi:16S rRNA (guanine527-N7)-methyltransferase